MQQLTALAGVALAFPCCASASLCLQHELFQSTLLLPPSPLAHTAHMHCHWEQPLLSFSLSSLLVHSGKIPFTAAPLLSPVIPPPPLANFYAVFREFSHKQLWVIGFSPISVLQGSLVSPEGSVQAIWMSWPAVSLLDFSVQSARGITWPLWSTFTLKFLVAQGRR